MKPNPLRLALLMLIFMLLLPDFAQATHLRAGEITVRRDACNSRRFWITVTVFTNTLNTNVLFGGDDDILDFGDGSDPDGDGRPGILVPETENTQRPDLGEGIATASFTIDHIYSGNEVYVISYSEPNRNEGVINMDGSVNTRFYIETKILIDFGSCNENSPVLAVPPIDRGCTGVAWFHNPGAFDLDGDSLSYEMVIPFRERGTTVVNYRSPDSPGFYPGNYETGNETGDNVPTFGINPVDGTITWDAPGTAGEYNIAFIINEWRQVQGEWMRTGSVRRDMQIIIEDCDNKRPDLIVPEDICVEAGTVLDATIFGTDPDNNNVKIEAFSEIFFLAEAQSPATYQPNPAVYQPSTPNPPGAILTFQWKTKCEHVKDQAYQVVFKITDDAETGPNLVTFKTWLIRVVGPRPQFPEEDSEAISTDLEDRTVTLSWERYFCENAESIQIWRRIDSLAFEPDTCQTGMPENLGYELIATVSANGDTTYTDTNNGQGLNAAAVYCYRLVAIFPAPRGGESPVSREVCIPAILPDEPVITKVSILQTGVENGQIRVSWVPPFGADPIQYPPPYTYDVFRAEASSTTYTKITETRTGDTTLVDTGRDTENKVYKYRVQSYAGTNPMDSSAAASTVRLAAQSELNKIELHWTADVPWSNVVPEYKHRVYRGDEGATTPAELTLIAEIDVVGTGFTYPDEGQHDGVPLESGKVYCYVIETLGSYGNDEPILAEKDPLRNFSQIVCTQPGDTLAPCAPLAPVADNPQVCETYWSTAESCNQNVFENVIKWSRVTDDCGVDVAFYNVYFTNRMNIDFVPLAEVRDTFFVHTGLTSYAACYKITAVDRSGNESELSEQICFDNCPYYELPNVFSPNGDDCNDVFSAYNTRETSGESGEETDDCYVKDEDIPKCARFVEDVTFTVYNRWGKEVYRYTTVGSSGDRTIFIDWNGKASDGTDLSTGIYYYVADVVFNTVDPSTRNQTRKGWVHLQR